MIRRPQQKTWTVTRLVLLLVCSVALLLLWAHSVGPASSLPEVNENTVIVTSVGVPPPPPPLFSSPLKKGEKKSNSGSSNSDSESSSSSNSNRKDKEDSVNKQQQQQQQQQQQSKGKRPRKSEKIPPSESDPLLPLNNITHKGPIEVSRIATPLTTTTATAAATPTDTFENQILMPPHIPHPQPDTYHCISQRAPQDLSHIISFRPLDEEGHIHHMILFACEQPWQPKEGQFWDCLSLPVCKSQSLLAYAWALRAPPLDLPENIGYVVGGETVAKFFVLQIHFKNPSPGVPVPVGLHMTLKKGNPEKYVGMLLMIGVNFLIPPKDPNYHVTLACDFNYAEDVHFFAYRTHAHYLGRNITGTYGRNGRTTTLSVRSAQQPQTFILMEEEVDIKKGDRMTADCHYDSMKKNIPTGVGSRSTDEMCNLYYMFWTETPSQASLTCVGKGENAHFDDFHSALTKGSAATLWEGDDPHLVETPSLQLPQDTQIVSVEITPEHIVAFHRGGVVWDGTSYTASHTLTNTLPISRPVLSFISRKDGKIVSEWGGSSSSSGSSSGSSDGFYMPHGFFIDKEKNMWFTDCGSHEVYKYVNFELTLVLGTKFQSGNDHTHFCKPTDVLVADDASIFVADGYCNSRLMHFAPNGAFLEEIFLPSPRGGVPSLPHSMALNSETDEIYVADRENGRILRVGGSPFRVAELMQFTSSPIFALCFTPAAGGLLAAVTHSNQDSRSTLEVFSVKAKTGGSELLPLKDGTTVFDGLFLHDIAFSTTMTENKEGVVVEYFLGGKVSGASSNSPSLVRVMHNFTLKPMPISTLAGVAMEAGSHVGVVD